MSSPTPPHEGADPPPPVPHQAPIALADLLAARTPKLWITRGLIALNAAVFVLMVAAGVDPMAPTVPELLRWGANLGLLTGDGETWRLLTCTFVHAGLIHVAMNLWVLNAIGPFVERLLGNAGFLITYLFSGLAGSLASGLWHPQVTSVGASGAVFGVVGALLGVLVRRPLGLPEEGRRLLRRRMLLFVGLNVFIGLSIPRIDMAGHLGGLAAGFLAGLVLGRRTLLLDTTGRKARNRVLAVAGAVVIAVGTLLLPSDGGGTVRISLELEELRARSTVIATSIDERFERGALSVSERRAEIERDLIAPWRALDARIQALPPGEDGAVEELRGVTRRVLDAYESALVPVRDGER